MPQRGTAGREAKQGKRNNSTACRRFYQWDVRATLPSNVRS
jgi:hypothetical protein